MEFGFTQEWSRDVLRKGDLITALSDKAEEFFKTKDYGPGLDTLLIGMICVAPEFDFFFKIRKKYSKSKKSLEYDIKLDHERFKKADNKEIYEIVRREVLNSTDIVEELKVIDFDLEKFRKDLALFFEENVGLGEVEEFHL